MRPDDFAPTAPGRLKRSMQGHYVYDPDPIPPPDERLAFDMPTVGLLGRAERALGRLQGVGQMLANPQLLIRPFLRREAVASSRIEGTITQLDQLLLFEVEPSRVADREDADEVLNYVVALEYGLEQIKAGAPLTLRLIREAHTRLMRGVRGDDKRPGEFRPCDVRIGRSGESWDDTRFVPPAHGDLTPLLTNLERYLNSPTDLPIPAQMAIMHYQFETIHPFMDGNGRIGRLLFSLLLCERGVLTEPLLYLSNFLERNDEEYRDHLLAVSRRGTWGEWIRFIARGVAEQADDASRRAEMLVRLNKEYRDKFATQSRSVVSLRLIDHIFAAPFVTIPQVATALDLSYPGSKSAIEALVGAGILREIDSTSRPKIYVADRVLSLIDSPVASPDQRNDETN